MFSITALNHKKIELHPVRVSTIKPFINKYNWKGINYPSKQDYWKTFEKNNRIIALNSLYIKEKETCATYISKLNSNCAKQTILLMIPSEEKEGLHDLAIKKLFTSLRGIISKHHGDFII